MLFSVIIPVYNGSNFLSEAIDSVLGQAGIERSEFEILVVNDGSRDGGETKRCAEGYGDQVRYFEKENGGVSTALNLGISQAKGDFICWLSHDDVFCKDKLATQRDAIEKLRRDGVVDFVLFSEQSFIDKNSNPVLKKRNISKETGALFTYTPEQAFNSLILGKLRIGGCTIAIPIHLFGKGAAGYFVEDFRYIQDFAMWVNMALTGASFVRQDRVLVYSRVHAGQQTGRFQERLRGEARSFYDLLVDNRRRDKALLSGERLVAVSYGLGKYNMFSCFFYNRVLLRELLDSGVFWMATRQFFSGFLFGIAREVYRNFVNFRYR